MGLVSQPVWVVKQAISHPMATVVGYAGLTGLAIGYAPTRRLGFRMGSFGIRAAGNVTWGATRGLLGTTLVRGSSLTLGGFVGLGVSSVMVGYAIGAVGGTIIAQTVWGDEGASDALDLYTGQVSWSQYKKALSNLLDN